VPGVLIDGGTTFTCHLNPVEIATVSDSISPSEVTVRQMAEGTCQVKNSPARVVESLINELEGNPPQTLAAAREKLQSLLNALHKANDAKWASSTDKQAILADVSVGVEAAGIVTVALAELKKAEDAATAALTRVFKTLQASRLEQRVWRKLRPAAASESPASK
jgi:hypothetical protein